VVAMGEGTGNTLGWSVELCGGTHVRRTGDIGLISVVGEAGVAAGVRRIEALTGKAARKTANKQLQVVKAAAAELKVPLEEMPGRIGTLVDERKKLERELADAKKKLAMGGGGGAAAGAKGDVTEIHGVKVVAKELTGVKFSDLRGIADDYKKQLGSGVVILSTSSEDGKVSLVVGVTPDLTSSNNAVQMVQAGVPLIGGSGGGGRPDMAQGGGTDPSGSTKAFDEIKQLVRPASATSKSN